MIKEALELTRKIHAGAGTDVWSLYQKRGDLSYSFFEQSETLAAYKGIRLPDYAEDMPKLEKDKSVYDNCSRWFMQSTPQQAIGGILDLMAAHPEGKTFIDVGSGTSFVVSLARELGLEAKGIEASKVLIDFVPGLQGLDVINQDFFTFDGFNQFDLIYMWNPIPYQMVRLGQHITDQITGKVAIAGLNEGVLGTPEGALREGVVLDNSWNTEGRVITRGIPLAGGLDIGA